jgi:selenide,water dikinase
LRELIVNQPAAQNFSQLLVGTETGDDAAVWRLDDGTCIIATTDFFMPMVDDPFDFGRIAAANAISDVYAMGGTPTLALAILGVPLGKIAPETVRMILDGGRAVCAEAGIPVAGGHSIDCPELVYGLAVVGTSSPENIRRNAGAKIGDAIILTKPLGVGVYSAAFKKDLLSSENYAEMVSTMTKLNRVGVALARNVNVHAMTDVTGFGLLGHALEMAQGSGVTMALEFGSLPFLRDAVGLVQRGCVTGASNRNWASYSASVALPPDCSDWQRHLLTDPQTSGGLLIATAPDRADELSKSIVAEGYPSARVIGRIVEGPAAVRVER